MSTQFESAQSNELIGVVWRSTLAGLLAGVILSLLLTPRIRCADDALPVHRLGTESGDGQRGDDC